MEGISIEITNSTSSNVACKYVLILPTQSFKRAIECMMKLTVLSLNRIPSYILHVLILVRLTIVRLFDSRATIFNLKKIFQLKEEDEFVLHIILISASKNIISVLSWRIEISFIGIKILMVRI